ncbi:MAG UNVERIFIED_CONTAM: hypothetical protein LVR18_26585 [Planctomycetaceae bacterium]|jgi:DNA polymerase-3 subunit alpha
MRDLLTKMKPDCFADIIATSALYRPGPLEGGMVMEYVDVKHGRKPPRKVHPTVDEVLSETYGVMVYQEQVMRILNRVGNIELSKAYKCIKAISKKQEKVITGFHSDYITGAVSNGIPEQVAPGTLEPDRGLRRLRLQQISLYSLRSHRLGNCFSQGPLSR